VPVSPRFVPNNVTVTIVAVLILGLGAIALLVWFTRGETDCVKLLPSSTEIGVGGSSASGIDGNAVGRHRSEGAQSVTQANAYLACRRLQAQRDAPAEPSKSPDYTAIQESSLGQLENHWRTETDGFRIHLRPALENNVLENMAVGPASGLKQDVMISWCQDNVACVACRFDPPSGNSRSVSVELRQARPTMERRPMSLPGPAMAASPPVRYEDIEAGQRYLWRCPKRH
jgi:hypothetical protein